MNKTSFDERDGLTILTALSHWARRNDAQAIANFEKISAAKQSTHAEMNIQEVLGLMKRIAASNNPREYEFISSDDEDYYGQSGFKLGSSFGAMMQLFVAQEIECDESENEDDPKMKEIYHAFLHGVFSGMSLDLMGRPRFSEISKTMRISAMELDLSLAEEEDSYELEKNELLEVENIELDFLDLLNSAKASGKNKFSNLNNVHVGIYPEQKTIYLGFYTPDQYADLNPEISNKDIGRAYEDWYIKSWLPVSKIATELRHPRKEESGELPAAAEEFSIEIFNGFKYVKQNSLSVISIEFIEKSNHHKQSNLDPVNAYFEVVMVGNYSLCVLVSYFDEFGKAVNQEHIYCFEYIKPHNLSKEAAREAISPILQKIANGFFKKEIGVKYGGEVPLCFCEEHRRIFSRNLIIR